MRNYCKIIVIVLLLLIFFVPFYPVTVVPEWELQFVNKDGTPASSIRFDQSWKHYSLEWSSEASDEGLQTDSNGYVKLPVRQIRASLFQLVFARISDFIIINPHASSGPSTTIICRGSANCVVKYEGSEKPQLVVLW